MSPTISTARQRGNTTHRAWTACDRRRPKIGVIWIKLILQTRGPGRCGRRLWRYRRQNWHARGSVCRGHCVKKWRACDHFVPRYGKSATRGGERSARESKGRFRAIFCLLRDAGPPGNVLYWQQIVPQQLQSGMNSVGLRVPYHLHRTTAGKHNPPGVDRLRPPPAQNRRYLDKTDITNKGPRAMRSPVVAVSAPKLARTG